jgi:hypothetical protein
VVPTAQDYYNNPYQYSMEDYTTSTPEGDIQAISYGPGYLEELLALRERVRSGTASEWDREYYAMQERAARAIPLRDVRGLSYNAGEEGTGAYVSGGSPDLGHLMLSLAEKLERGQATTQERDLFETTYKALADQNYRASVPQASDAFNPLGDNLLGALSILGIGASMGGLGPLLAGGVTAGSLGAAAGTAGSITGMLGQAVDEPALKQLSMALGLGGSVAGLGSLLSSGVSSVGDVLKLAQKTYGAYQKGTGLARSIGQASSAPDRPVGSTSSSDRSGSAGGGSGMDFSQLGPVLAGVVGMVGQGLSLADASRYMDQLKDNFGDQQEIKDMIDQAYKLAVTRYETTYARSEEEWQQKQEQYNDQKAKYDTHYQQTQAEQQQKQAAYAKGEGQLDEDRATQMEHYRDQRAKYDQSYQSRVQEAAEDRDRRINVFGEDRQMVMADYNRRVQEAAQDRQKEYATFDQQMARHLGTQDKREAEVAQDRAKQYGVFDEQYGAYKGDYARRVAEAAQERGMDLAGYEARHAIGADLRDPTKIKAGAEALYQPLSDLARGNISSQVQAEMAQRGVAGGGQYANLMSAKAFAPSEQALWQNALAAYMQGQTGALNAYGNVDLAGSPEYRFQQVPQFSQTPGYQWANVPNFTNSPEYKYANVPEMGGTPRYEGTNVPRFDRASATTVPGTVGLDRTPTVPTYTAPGTAPPVNQFLPKPYSAYDGSGPGGKGGIAGGMQGLVSELTKALGGGGAQALMKMLGIGGGTNVPSSFTGWGGNEQNQPWYDPAYIEDSPWNWQGSQSDYSNWDPWEGIDYNPDAGSDFDYW